MKWIRKIIEKIMDWHKMQKRKLQFGLSLKNCYNFVGKSGEILHDSWGSGGGFQVGIWLASNQKFCQQQKKVMLGWSKCMWQKKTLQWQFLLYQGHLYECIACVVLIPEFAAVLSR